uniref:Uncharacterized protein n=1 Tax=Anguilla anguilla TaxID=7936 RepID=A0A0E9TN42_ANGAN
MDRQKHHCTVLAQSVLALTDSTVDNLRRKV